ncbi:hypothetical protein CA13_42160 [Planctomycetes bacterium CA13]|uniref:Uncharacterized protein n=1 Tax=Novipirellula herctigrandis TaxID=2527986 RepID=A0A5C5Z8A4_9BACT|nr:hypothetical protein CA13_42160 [Planctomycetes bacterium CA13]
MRIRGMNLATFAEAYASGRRRVPTPTHVFLCVADHYEPQWNHASVDQQLARVDRWIDEYPNTVDGCADSRGRPPQHTFFYPIECYDAKHLDKLATLVRAGYGDVEIHLHHDDDNGDSLRQLLLESIQTLHDRHGLLKKDPSGQIRYGFIHGNWALDNSHPDGKWCGVNNEITILRETGCFADFTMPAAPHSAQIRTINQIYYAIDDPDCPKSHDTGIEATTGRDRPNDGLLMIQGPLVVKHERPWRKPSVENGNVARSQPLLGNRVDDWLRANVTVTGHSKWQFIKLHTHGGKPANADVWLSEEAKRFHNQLNRIASERDFRYYYVTANEMAKLVAQAERGIMEPDWDSL